MSVTRRLPLLEIAGIAMCGLGICFAVACVGLGLDSQRAKGEKTRIEQSVEEMNKKLRGAKIPDDQIAGLLQIHKRTLAVEAVQEGFIITTFLLLLSLVVASFGFSLVLLGKLRMLSRSLDISAKQNDHRSS